MTFRDLEGERGYKIYGWENDHGEPVTLIYGSVDIRTAECWEEDTTKYHYLDADTELEPYKDGYRRAHTAES